MPASPQSVTVEVWQTPGLLLEFYRYGPGRHALIPRHAHAEYQLGLCLDHPGRYRYRGGGHELPVGSVSVLHPQEPHVTGSGRTLEAPGRNLMLFVPPGFVREVAAHMAGRPAGREPFFAEPVLTDPVLTELLFALHASHASQAPRLEQESLLQSAVARLVRRHGMSTTASDSHSFAPEPARVRRVREFLEAHSAENTSLETLARLAGLSPYHLCRVFKDATGAAPHAYQTQLRVARAKKLLLMGQPLKDVAHEVGFFDQSHLLRHFRRFTGTSPGRYRAAAPAAAAPQASTR
jgi:AraC-like DNA-binding protein